MSLLSNKLIEELQVVDKPFRNSTKEKSKNSKTHLEYFSNIVPT